MDTPHVNAKNTDIIYLVIICYIMFLLLFDKNTT